MLEIASNRIPNQGQLAAALYGHSPPNVYGTPINYNLVKNQYLPNGRYQPSELLRIMSTLAKFQLGLSCLYILQGLEGDLDTIGVGRVEEELEDMFSSWCLTNLLAGLAGAVSSLVGLWAISRYRWKCSMVAYLAMAILSSVAFLLVIIHSGIWLGHAQTRAGESEDKAVKLMVAAVLLVAVALGVCFIISASFICHLWVRRNKRRKRKYWGLFPASNVFAYSPVIPPNYIGPIPMGQPMTAVAPSGMKTLEYHICTSHCKHLFEV